jgi:hypothetical protein
MGLGARRSVIGAGGGGFSPADEAGLAVWIDANEGITADEDGVTQWVTQDANAWVLAQANGAKKPDVVAEKQNGLTAIYFDGVDDRLQQAEPGDVLIDGGSGITMFVSMELEARHATAIRTPLFIESNHGVTPWYGRLQIRAQNAPNDADYFGPGVNQIWKEASYPGGTALIPHIYGVRVNANSINDDLAYVQNIEGLTGGSTTYGTIFNSGKLRLGTYNGGTIQTWLHETIVYEGKKSVEFCTTVFDYLNAKWVIYA